MKILTSVVSAVCMMGIVFSAPAMADGFKEGKWAMTMVTKMQNMPPEMAAAMQQMQNMSPESKAIMQQRMQQMGFSMSGNPSDGITVTVTQCLTKQNPVPKNNKMPQSCEETHEMNGNTVNFHTTCNQDDTKMDATGSMVYNGDSMQGHIKSHESRAGKDLDATIDITGKYAGPCS